MADFLLVFDLDGTLIDTVPDLANALNHVLREHGHAPFSPREVQAMVGDGIPALVTRGFAARGADAAEASEALPEFLALYEANAANLSRPYPGVRDTLIECLPSQGPARHAPVLSGEYRDSKYAKTGLIAAGDP